MDDPELEATLPRRPRTVYAYILLGLLGVGWGLVDPGPPGPVSILFGLAIAALFWVGLWNGSRLVWWLLVAGLVVFLPFTVSAYHALESNLARAVFVSTQVLAVALLLAPSTYRWCASRGPRHPATPPT